MLQHPFITVDQFVRFLISVFYWQIVRQEFMTYLFYEAQIKNDFMWTWMESKIQQHKQTVRFAQ